MANMSIEEIIAKLEEMEADREDILPGCLGYDEAEPLREAIALLKTHPDAQPNEPLTLEELLEMDGQPVWVVSLDQGEQNETGWYLVNTDAAGSRCGTLETCFNEIGLSDWDDQVLYKAYRRLPATRCPQTGRRFDGGNSPGMY